VLSKEENQCIRKGSQNMVKKIKQYQEKWLHHVQRMDTNRILKQALRYKPKGRRNIGRPSKRWRDQLHLEDQATGNTPNPSWIWWWCDDDDDDDKSASKLWHIIPQNTLYMLRHSWQKVHKKPYSSNLYTVLCKVLSYCKPRPYNVLKWFQNKSMKIINRLIWNQMLVGNLKLLLVRNLLKAGHIYVLG
jgi:hypothetical protein